MSLETKNEWERRASRPGLPSVMSNRWAEEESRNATISLQGRLLSAMGELKGKRLLEVGCGIGRLTPSFKASGADVVAIDYSMGMLQRAHSSLPELPLINATAAALPVPDRAFDSSVAVTVLQHIVDPEEFVHALQEMKRVTQEKIVICDELRLDKPEQISPYTVLRTIEIFQDHMMDWRLVAQDQFSCITDLYTLMVWERQNS